MHMASSDPYHGAVATSTRPKHRHRTSVATYGATVPGAHPSKVTFASPSRYQTQQLLGRGGMSEVYRGFDVRLRRPVAIKRLRADLAINPLFRARFRREAQAAGSLSHSAIVAVYDTGEEREATGASIPFIVMELVEGHSLRDALREEGALPPVRALELTAAVLDALACSHFAGIIHRDIKPANVMLTSTGGVKVADFGIARAVSDTTDTVTLAGSLMGTPQYLSPEQGRGEPVDVRSDLYSVGCMLYELLVGQPPFTGDSPVSIVVQHVSEAPAPPSMANCEISTDIDAIILKALAKEPADRYQTASEMKADIDRVLSGHTPAAATLLEPLTVPGSSAARDGNVAMAHQWNATHLLAVMIVVLVVAGASVLGVYQSSRSAAAESSTIEVPAVLGLGRSGAESLLRNAKLVPRFEFVHGTEDATVGTVINQSPGRGATAAINSTVVVKINIGSRQDASTARYVGNEGRLEARPPSISSSDNFRPDVNSGYSGSQARQSDRSTAGTGAHRVQGGDSKKSERAAKKDKDKKSQ
jgi:eukaryotic-like serine/threonine-protein kinase